MDLYTAPRRRLALLFLTALLMPLHSGADPMRARYKQGALHAFLLIRSEDGKVIGTGDEVNEPVGANWRSRLTLRFHDGSVDDETALYNQHSAMHLLSDRHTQRGPSFPKPMDMSIDTASGTVQWHDFHDGKDEPRTEHMDMPADLSNGMMPWVLQNISITAPESKVSYIVATPSPRMVKLVVHPDGMDRFHIGGGASRSAAKFRIHVELGGVAGVVAPIVGKEPPDLHAWVVRDNVPTFLRLQSFLFLEGPIWNVELTSPAWSS